MNEFALFTLIGLGVGALYALAAQGLVVIYRGSGVLNFSQGAFAMVGAYTFYELHLASQWPWVFSALAGIAASTLVGVLLYLVLLRRLKRAAPLMRIVATLALLITVQGIATVHYGAAAILVPSELSQNLVTLWSGVAVPEDRLILLGVAVGVTAGLYALYRFTSFGRATTAVAENQRAAASVGLSPDLIAAANWALGSALAALAAILVLPVTGLSVEQLTGLALASLAAGLVGGFKSFPLTLIGALAIGIAQTQLERVTAVPELSAAAPLVAIVLILVIGGRSLPLRDYFLQRQPKVGTGRLRASLIVPSIVVVVVLSLVLSSTWQDALTITFSTATVILSIVVVTGYAGQISLAQWAFAGVGAVIASKLIAGEHWGFLPAMIVALLASALAGAAFAVTAVRTRGITLAIATLSLGSAIEYMIFDNLRISDGGNGIPIGTIHLFGINVSAIDFPGRYAVMAFAFFMICAVAVANLRRGRVGRRMLAVRSNERAAAALGINVPWIKLYAFALAAAIAALGGIVYAFQNQTVLLSAFTNSYSITLIGFAVIGGVAWVGGSVLGGQFAVGAFGAQVLSEIWPSAASYIESVSGAVLLVIIATHPDGMAQQTTHIASAIAARLRSVSWLPLGGRAGQTPANETPKIALVPSAAGSGNGNDEHQRVPAKALVVENLTLTYGSVTAVNDVSLRVNPGEVVGLIGANGAGKTSLIDAVSGFVTPRSGKVSIGDVDVTKWGATRRTKTGVSRSFQGLELFEDMTVLDNLRTAYEPHDVLSYGLDLVYPRAHQPANAVIGVLNDFGLIPYLNYVVEDLPYGTRRLVAIARTIATLPSVVLLDEPAAGLSETETKELGGIVRKLASERGLGVLVVEHDVNFVMGVCDRIIVIDFGREIAEGPPGVIREDERVIEAYLGVSGDETAQVQTGAL